MNKQSRATGCFTGSLPTFILIGLWQDFKTLIACKIQHVQVYVPQDIHKFTFWMKSQGHFLINTFCILICAYFAKFVPMGSKICKTKRPIFIYC